jgi:hypothetical protein
VDRSHGFHLSMRVAWEAAARPAGHWASPSQIGRGEPAFKVAIIAAGGFEQDASHRILAVHAD